MSVNMIKQSIQTENLSLKAEVDTLLVELGVEPISYAGGALVAKTPITGETVAHVREVDAAGTTSAIEKAHAAFPRVASGPCSQARRTRAAAWRRASCQQARAQPARFH